MLFRAIVIALFLLLLAYRADAPAAELVVMNTDSTTVPGAKVYTVGVQVTQADVFAGINEVVPGLGRPFGPNVPLGVQEVDFMGNILNSQQTTAFNYRSLQSIQTQYIDPAALNNPVAPGLAAGPPETLGAVGSNVLNASSWWYASDGGQLLGINDSAGDTGVVSSTSAADGSGVYTIGPTNNVGALGLDWVVTPHTYPGTAGMTVSEAFYGGYGPQGYLDRAPISNQFVNGVLTVPLAQVVANGNVTLNFEPIVFANGETHANNFIVIGGAIFNFLGGDANVDPHAVLDYSTNTIHSLLTAGGGTATVGGIQVDPTMITTNGDLSSTYASTSATNLAATIGAAAAGQINFALAGSTVQAWEVQYTGTLAGSNTIVFHYDPALIGSTPEADLRIEHFVNGAWVVPAGQVVDTAAHTITFQTDSFSPFVLSQVPEPSGLVLLVLGAVATCATKGRRARRRLRPRVRQSTITDGR